MEYALLVATFVAIMVLGLELGIAAGIVAASLIFAYQYSKVTVNKQFIVLLAVIAMKRPALGL